MDKIYEETTQEWYDAYFQFIYFQIINNRYFSGQNLYCLWENPIYTSKYSTSMQSSINNNIFIPLIRRFEYPIIQKTDVIPHPDDRYFWEKLSIYNDLTWSVVEQHIDKPWDWDALSYHSCVTWDIIQRYPEKPWYWTWISINPNIGFEIIQQYPDKLWNWLYICSNDMSIARENSIRKNSYTKLREWFAKSDVKRELMEKLWHPRNMHKWSGWGYDILEEEQEQEQEE
jgi:hypothetical protein